MESNYKLLSFNPSYMVFVLFSFTYFILFSYIHELINAIFFLIKKRYSLKVIKI